MTAVVSLTCDVELTADAGAAFRADLDQLAKTLGFQGAVYMHLGHGLRSAADPSVRTQPRHLAATVAFDEAQYLRRGYFNHDPIACRAVDRLEPFAWRLDEFDDGDLNQRRVLTTFDSWGLRAGIVTPVMDYVVGPAFLNLFAADGTPAASADRGGLMLAAIRMHAAARRAAPAVNEAAQMASFSPREMAVLRLAALGHTEQETAVELALSRRGVQFHLSRAMEKLGASNKTAAVARAVGAGLIEI